MAKVPRLKNAWVQISGDRIVAFGEMSQLPCGQFEEISADGRLVMPTSCDSHTHLVYAGSRELEYTDKIKGLSYEEIAKVMQCPVGTVRSRIFRARAAIDARLQPLLA